MQTLLTIWRLLESVGLLVIPQLLGILAYFRVRKYHHNLAHIVGFLLPPILFFYLSRLMLISSAAEIQSQGERVCGTAQGMMALAILFVTGVQMLFSLIAQLVLRSRDRTSGIPKQV